MDRIDGVEEAHGAAIAEWCDRVQVEIEVGPVPSEQEWAAYMRARKVRDDLKRKREAAAGRAFKAEVARRWGEEVRILSNTRVGGLRAIATRMAEKFGFTPAEIHALAKTGELPEREEYQCEECANPSNQADCSLCPEGDADADG